MNDKVLPVIGVKGLIGVMLIALLGLLAIQWYWVHNAVSLREARFRRQVNDALARVAERLQERETVRFISEDIVSSTTSSNSYTYRFDADTPDADTERTSFRVFRKSTVRDGKREEQVEVVVRDDIGNKGLPGKKSKEEVVVANGNERSTRPGGEDMVLFRLDSTQGTHTLVVALEEREKYVNRVIDRMLIPDRPVEERLDPAVTDSLIRGELAARDIPDPFEFELIKGPAAAGTAEDGESAAFTVRLFPRDLHPSDDYLRIRFPDRPVGAVRAMSLLLSTSGVLVLVVVLCFGASVYALQRHKKLSGMKSDFINNMTHELKTPISTISLALEALEDPDMQDEKALGRYREMIAEENDRLRTHVERVLQAAAFERGSFHLNPTNLDANEVARGEIERIRPHVEERGGVIRFMPAPGGAPLRADRMHLAGMLSNLLDNANKYSPGRPEIDVTVALARDGLRIRVTDQGPGMSREAQKRIFEQFYRVPTGKVHDVKGFGLGLSYVRGMMEAHGGKVTVRSSPGAGSCFTLHFPSTQTTVQ